MPNTPVSINLPSATSVPVDTPQIIALSISDADSGIPGAIYTVSLMPAHGTLSLGSEAGITIYPEPIIGFVDMTNIDPDMDIFSAPPPGSLFIGGSFADINAALATLTFTPTPGYSGPGVIEMIVSDHPEQTGMDTWGPRTSDYEAIALNIGGNQPPAIANLDGDTIAYTEEDPATFIDLGLDALVTDDNPSLDGGTLTIAIVANKDFSEDIIAFDYDNPNIQFGENDDGTAFIVIVDGTVIGTMPFEYGAQGDNIAITFNADATAAHVTTLLNALTYRNLDIFTPSTGTRTIEISLTDGSGPEAQTRTVQTFVTVTDTPEVNHPAVFDLNGAAAGVDVTRSYTENGAAIQLAPSATSTDVDPTVYNGGSLVIQVTDAATTDQLTVVAGGTVALWGGGTIDVNGSIIATYSGGTNGTPLVINFLPDGSSSQTPSHVVDDIVKAIRYSSTSNAPDATREIVFTLNDGGGTEFGGHDTSVATATVTITAVDDKPVVEASSVSLPATSEDNADPLGWTVGASLNFAFSDGDGDTLAGIAITGNAAGSEGVWQYNDGSGWVAIGTPSAASALVVAAGSQLRFLPAANFVGEAPALTARLIDSSHGGDASGAIVDLVTHGGDSQYSSGSVTITQTVNPVNDEPSGADNTVTIDEDDSYTFQLADFGFSDAIDGDSFAGIVVTTTPADGALYLDGSPVVLGTVIEAWRIAAGDLEFYGGPNANGTVSFTFQVQDDGGLSGVDTDSTPDTMTIEIASGEDLPTAVTDAPTVNADTTIDIPVLSNDIDPDGGANAVVEINGSAVSIGVPVTLASGARVTLNANGTITYDPNGQFNNLVSPSTASATLSWNDWAPDSFSYTLNGGSTATVSVAVIGVDGPGDRLEGTAAANSILGTNAADTVMGFEGVDMLYGNDGDDVLYGNDANDALFGGTNNDRLYGGNGDDSLQGGDGNDVLIGNLGDDTLAGGLGDDVYYVDSAGDTVAENLDEGHDAVRSQIDYTLTDNVEELFIGGAARDGTGNGLDNTLHGSASSNTLSGLDGDDIPRGGGGRDLLLGGAGEDLIDGGVGKDTLTGGADRDVFQFRDGDMGTSRPLADLITDFSQADSEKIHLGLVDADTGTGGDQAFAFVGTAAFTGTAGELRFQVMLGDTWISADVDGDGAADWYIGLTGIHALTASDFVL